MKSIQLILLLLCLSSIIVIFALSHCSKTRGFDCVPLYLNTTGSRCMALPPLFKHNREPMHGHCPLYSNTTGSRCIALPPIFKHNRKPMHCIAPFIQTQQEADALHCPLYSNTTGSRCIALPSFQLNKSAVKELITL